MGQIGPAISCIFVINRHLSLKLSWDFDQLSPIRTFGMFYVLCKHLWQEHFNVVHNTYYALISKELHKKVNIRGLSTVKPQEPIGCLLTSAGRIVHAQRFFVYKAIFEFVRILWLLKMTKKQDQRTCIKFCFQLGKKSSETIQMMQKAFGNECISKKRMKEWYNRFKGGRTSVDSDSRSGRPSTTKTLDNIERVWLAIEGDRRLTVRELENDLGIPKTTVWEILNKILGMTCVCAVTGFFTMITRQRIHRILYSSFWVNTVSHYFNDLRTVPT